MPGVPTKPHVAAHDLASAHKGASGILPPPSPSRGGGCACLVCFWHKPLAPRPSQALQAPLKGRQRVPGAGPGILEISPRLQKKPAGKK